MPGQHIAHRRRGNFKVLRYDVCGETFAHDVDLLNVVSRQERDPASSHVLRVSDCLKVIRSNTRRILAKMVKFKSIWDKAISSLVEVPIRKAAPAGLLAPNPSVSSLVLSPLPHPTWGDVSTILNEVFDGGRSSMMARYISDGQATHPSLPRIGLTSKLGRLTASAHAQSRRVGAGILMGHLGAPIAEMCRPVGVSAPPVFSLPQFYQNPRSHAEIAA